MAQLHLPVRPRPAQSSSLNNFLPSRFAFGSGSHSNGIIKKENLGPRGSTDLSPIHSEDEDDANETFSPVNPRTWGKETPAFLQNGTLLPASRRPVPRPKPQALRDPYVPQPRGHDGRITGTAATAQGPDLAPDSEQFLGMMDDKLRVGEHKPTPSASAEYHVAHVRSASSSYPSPGDTATRVQSPDSVMRQNRLSVTDLARITQANGRLSILRSSSSLSDHPLGPAPAPAPPPHSHTRAPSVQDVLVESSSAIAQWQKELRLRPSSYLQYELADSTEVLPTDSLSAQRSPCSQVSPSRMIISPSLTWENLRAIRAQYDGAHESLHPALRPDPQNFSPAPDAVPSCAAENDLDSQRPSKRKASYFSLRSLSLKSLTKRPRLGLRKWAENVVQQGSHRLRVARQKFREQAEMDRRAFQAWRARRHRDRHVGEDPEPMGAELPGSKSEGNIPQRRNEEWWRDGVTKFEAPKWMAFRGGSGTLTRHRFE